MTGEAGVRRRIVFVAANPSVDHLYEVERLTAGAIHRPDLVVALPGGKGLNAARAAATLGARVTAVGIVGGRTGDWIVEQLGTLGIDASMARSARQSRTCVTIVDRATGALTELYERGEPIDPEAWTALEAVVADELDRGDVGALTFSGSLPPGAPGDGYARIARIAAERSVDVFADTYGPALAAVLAERPALVKVNATEAGDATRVVIDGPGPAASAARTLRGLGAHAVVVTLGADGAVGVTPSAEWRLVPPALRGAYPVGSGDAFLGGLAAAYVDGASLEEAGRLGMAAGIANALRPGAGELDPASARRLLTEVRVAPI